MGIDGARGRGEQMTLLPDSGKVKKEVALFVGIAIVMGYFAMDSGDSKDWLYVLLAVGLAIGSPFLRSSKLNYLKLNSQGFEFATIGRKKSFTWNDVSDFKPVTVSKLDTVGFNSREVAGGSPMISKLSQVTAGTNCQLPGCYGMKQKDLAALMNKWKERNS